MVGGAESVLLITLVSVRASGLSSYWCVNWRLIEVSLLYWTLKVGIYGWSLVVPDRVFEHLIMVLYALNVRIIVQNVFLDCFQQG